MIRSKCIAIALITFVLFAVAFKCGSDNAKAALYEYRKHVFFDELTKGLN